MKNTALRYVITVFVLLLLIVLVGCNGIGGQKEFLTVDFERGQSLKYKFVSSRDIIIDWEPEKEASPQKDKSAIDKSSESMEMVVSYTPVETDSSGLTTIEAMCESVKINRNVKNPPRKRTPDAVKSFENKTFRFKISPTGKMVDSSGLDELIKEVGKKAFRPKSKEGRIKEPDMIGDFTASQWFLWDAVSSIKRPSRGVAVGQVWQSVLSVPTPMVMREARDVTYTLAEVQESENGPLAVIKSSFSSAKSVPQGWPIPYAGAFRVSGRFGLIRGYKVMELQGLGEELFNIGSGRTEQYEHNYQLQLGAFMPLLGTQMKIDINQKLTMTLLDD